MMRQMVYFKPLTAMFVKNYSKPVENSDFTKESISTCSNIYQQFVLPRKEASSWLPIRNLVS